MTTCRIPDKVRYKSLDPPLTKTARRAFWRGDYTAMTLYLSEIDWKAELKGRSVQEIWNFICDKYDESIDKCFSHSWWQTEKKIKLYIE